MAREEGELWLEWDPVSDQVRTLVEPGVHSVRIEELHTYFSSRRFYSKATDSFLFVHAEEQFWDNPAKNEADGVYIYDYRTGKHFRPTSKWCYERPILWTPDGKWYLIERFNPKIGREPTYEELITGKPTPIPDPQLAKRPKEEEGFFFVNRDTGKMVPFIVGRKHQPGFPSASLWTDPEGFDEIGPPQFSEDPWSPDGKYLALIVSRRLNEHEGCAAVLLATFDGEKVGWKTLMQFPSGRQIDKTTRTVVFVKDALWLNPDE